MWRWECQKKSRYSASLLSSSFIVILMMLPIAAHGELECRAATWACVGDNKVNIDVNVSGEGSCQGTGEVDFPNKGFGFGLAYWFPRAPVLGVGLDFVSSVDHGHTMEFLAVDICMLFRLQFGQNSAFPHGRIVPYLGVGVGAQKLSGPVNIPSKVDSSNEVGVELQSSGLVLKAGLEWMILRWMAIYVEGRYMSGTMEGQKKATMVVPGGWFGPVEATTSCADAVAKFSKVQLVLGIALHI